MYYVWQSCEPRNQKLHFPTSTLHQLLHVIVDNMVSQVCSSWFTGYSLSRSEHNMCLSSVIGLVNDAVNSILTVLQVTTNKYIIYSSTALLSYIITTANGPHFVTDHSYQLFQNDPKKSSLK